MRNLPGRGIIPLVPKEKTSKLILKKGNTHKKKFRVGNRIKGRWYTPYLRFIGYGTQLFLFLKGYIKSNKGKKGHGEDHYDYCRPRDSDREG